MPLAKLEECKPSEKPERPRNSDSSVRKRVKNVAHTMRSRGAQRATNADLGSGEEEETVALAAPENRPTGPDLEAPKKTTSRLHDGQRASILASLSDHSHRTPVFLSCTFS